MFLLNRFGQDAAIYRVQKMVLALG